MGYEGYFKYNGIEVVNHSRLVQLSRSMGVDIIRIPAESVSWIEEQITGTTVGAGYEDVTNAPWYDDGYPASTEFAGVLVLSVAGLDDSSLEASPTEYITDGGRSGKPRHATQPLVWNVVLVGSTAQGVEFGKRWLSRTLRNSGTRTFCAGADLEYYRNPGHDPDLAEGNELVHRRNVSLTRGASVTRKRHRACSASWMATFTMTAHDPFEYSEPRSQIASLGGVTYDSDSDMVSLSLDPATGPSVLSYGTEEMEEEHCPVYDYTPVYDPDYPALVPAPAPPNFLPDGWGIEDGMFFRRSWARIRPMEPSGLDVVPVVVLTSGVEARMVRFSIWPDESVAEEVCGALYTAIVTYLPADLSMYLDGEQQAAYVWDGFSPAVRRTDSLVYGTDGAPVEWPSFNDSEGLLVTLDIFYEVDSDPDLQGGGDVRAALHFIAKSD